MGKFQKIICVLGMVRSGTSLMCMILDRLGVYFGPEENLTEPYDSTLNFWEHRGVKKINKEIFSRFGGNWKEPPIFPPGWQDSHKLEDLRERALDIIDREFIVVERWGFKDPRTCFTLPFWQQILPPMRYVICVRNPFDVGRSLERLRWDVLSLEKGFYLWLLYTKNALKNTIGQQRIIVFPENWFDNMQDELERLFNFLGNFGMPIRVDIESGVKDIIDENLWQNRISTRALSTVYQVYEDIILEKLAQQNDVERTFQEALGIVGPLAEKKEAHARARKQHNEYDLWMEQLNNFSQELDMLISSGENFILADQAQLGYEVIAGRRCIPFTEHKGQYGGAPPDDTAAIREFERLRGFGPSFMVFAWPAFWWLDYYSELNRYLRSKFHCIFQNERLIVFDLRS